MVMIVEQLVEWMSGKGKKSTWRKPAPVPLSQPDIAYDLTRVRTLEAGD
jgi:hypothetical protein